MTWRTRLAAIRTKHANADSVESADSSCMGAIGAFGTIDIGVDAENRPALGPWGQWALAYVEDAAAALAEPDYDLAAARAVMAQHYAAPVTPRPYVPGDPDPLRDGLLRGWRAHRAGQPGDAGETTT